MNPRILYTLAGILLLSGSALTGVWYATRGSADLAVGAFPQQISTRAEVRPTEEIRTVEFWPDGVTPRHGEALNTDQSVTHFFYRPNGTLKLVATYSKEDEQGNRVILRTADIAEDGKTYAHDVEYTAEGAVVKETHLVDPKTSKRVYYYDGGATRKSQVIALDDKGWKLRDEDVFRKDSTLAHTLRTGENTDFESRDFAEDGVRVVVSKSLVGGPYGQYTELTLADDGKTELRRVEQSTTKTDLTIKGVDGVVTEKRNWSGEVGKSTMMVYVMDRDGVKAYDQWWDFKNGKYVLWLVREYRPDGTQWRQLMYKQDGVTLDVELIYATDGRGGSSNSFLRRKYREDGTLATEEDVVISETIATRNFSAADNRHIEIPQARLAFTPFEAPPQVVIYSPPGPY